MFWVIHKNIFREEGFDPLIRALERLKLKFAVVKVVPFVGDIIPDINPKNPVIAIGAYSMWRVAKRKDGTQESL